MSLMHPCLIDPPAKAAPANVPLPYYHVRKLISGTYAVAHMVPGAQCAHLDATCGTLSGAMALCAQMESERRTQQAQHHAG